MNFDHDPDPTTAVIRNVYLHQSEARVYPEYSCSVPTGAVVGTRWVHDSAFPPIGQITDEWREEWKRIDAARRLGAWWSGLFLREYVDDPTRPGQGFVAIKTWNVRPAEAWLNTERQAV